MMTSGSRGNACLVYSLAMNLAATAIRSGAFDEGRNLSTVPAISVEGLSKNYGRLRAVRDLHLEVAQGEVFGFLGLNGAGKTTTIRILLDLLRPTGGAARVLGRDCQSESLAVRARVGYLPGEMGLYADMTGRTLLDLLAHLSGRP